MFGTRSRLPCIGAVVTLTLDQILSSLTLVITKPGENTNIFSDRITIPNIQTIKTGTEKRLASSWRLHIVLYNQHDRIRYLEINHGIIDSTLTNGSDMDNMYGKEKYEYESYSEYPGGY